MSAPRRTGSALLGRRYWAVALAVLLLATALLMPPALLPRDTFSYVVTFDITQSMSAEDVALNGAPASRLAYAKAQMREALGRLPCGSTIGWSVFTGQRALLLLQPVEVCANFDALLTSLDAVDGRMRWTNWSRIAEGGVYSAVVMATQLGHGTSVVFVTDGQEAPPLLPSQLRPWDLGHAIRGWLIGVGGDQPVVTPRSDENGNRIGIWGPNDVIQVPTIPGEATHVPSHEELTELRGPYLGAVAQRIGFDYRRLTSADALAQAMTDPRFAHRAPAATDLRWVPALVALLLLVWRYLPDRLPPRRQRGPLSSSRAAHGAFAVAPRATAGLTNPAYSRSR